MMSYIDNDDDLFDYDPNEDKNASLKEPSSFESFLSSSKKEEELNDSLSDILEENKIKLALSFHHATSHHFSKIETPAYIKSVGLVLDKLTNGDFSLIYMFYRKEALIAQKIFFLRMMESVLETAQNVSIITEDAPPQEESNSSVLSTILKALGLNMTEEHVSIFYGSSVSICKHSLTVDRIIYQHLSEKLSIPVIDSLLDPHYDHSNNAHYLQQIASSDIYNKIFESITCKLAEDGILEKLRDTFGTNVKLTRNV